jgi:hypothetical protein
VALDDGRPVVRQRSRLHLQREHRDLLVAYPRDRLGDRVVVDGAAESQGLVPIAPHGVADDDAVNSVGEVRGADAEELHGLG